MAISALGEVCSAKALPDNKASAISRCLAPVEGGATAGQQMDTGTILIELETPARSGRGKRGKGGTRMHLVERHVIKRADPRFAAIDRAALASKNLYNAANFVV